MKNVEVAPALTRREKRVFLTFPWKIYAGDPLWVPPLLPERAKVIDPDTGTFFTRGTAEIFVARRDGKPVGTISAAEDRVLNERRGIRECVFGFFECVKDYEVAKAMLDRVSRWAVERGLDRLAGPFNLDYEDCYGVLVEGRDRPPTMLCGHTPPYYQGFLETYGFSPLRGDNIAFEIPFNVTSPALERTAVMAERIRRKGWLTIRTPDPRRWEEEIDIVLDLLNRSTAHLPDYRPYERETISSMLSAFRSIADPDLILYAQADGRSVGWFPGLPNMNEVLIHANGLRYPWDRLAVLRHLHRKIECLTIKSVLILPEFWGSGAALLLFDEMARRARAKGYRWADLSLTSDDNPYTPGLAARMGARIYKRYRTYMLDLAAARRS
jgi:GNAT superfamily N-acetyltransferase